MPINPQVVYRRDSDDSALIFLPDTGKAFALNQVGIVIWDALTQNCSEPEILAKLAESCGTLPDTAAADLREFLARLRQVGALL